jgi:hypothetical protein
VAFPPRPRRALLVVLATFFVLAFVPALAHAKRHPQFEPTDLELEDPGTMELDLQLGLVKGSDAHRLVLPDFEFDLGLLENLELDVDGTYSIAGQPDGTPLFLDHSAPDNLWVSAKIGLYDGRDDAKHAWALGLQVGPKLPTGSDEHGVGVEGLALIARMDGRVHLVLGIGGLVDPHLTATPRPWGFETGLDLDLDLDDVDTWSLLGEIAFQGFGSPDPTQLNATIGLQYSPSPKLDLSVVAEAGFVPGSDPYGIFFGISPKAALW